MLKNKIQYIYALVITKFLFLMCAMIIW